MDHPEAIIPKVSTPLFEALKKASLYPPTPSKKVRRDSRGFYFYRYSYPTWPHHDSSTRPGLRYEIFAGIEGENWISLVCSSYGKGVEGIMMEELWERLQPLFERLRGEDGYQAFEKGPLGGRSGPNGSIGLFRPVALRSEAMSEALFELILATKDPITQFIKDWGPERVGGFTRMASKFK